MPEAFRPTVLLVDDEAMILRATRMVLEAAGFLVATASGGEEAIAIALREPPDVVLLDIMMPGVDGWETLAQLKADPRTRDVPVIVFTAREHTRGGRLAREAGAVDYLPKPFEPDDLVARVRARARRAAGAHG